jgi:hypothetical protein
MTQILHLLIKHSLDNDGDILDYMLHEFDLSDSAAVIIHLKIAGS